MSTSASIVNKIAVCCCCMQTSCIVASMYEMWTAAESYGLCYLNCLGCWWTLCAPLCHQCKLGDSGEAIKKMTTALKYGAFCCALQCVAPCDAIYNCVFYQVDNFTAGVSGFKDIMKNTMWLGKKVEQALGLQTGNQPEKTFGTFTP